ncbi:unnamed protein product (macronuclear) [Paramecium tetraurelia]|uniref:Uncharacterized protein n=1 Tax=Paramecium tetraurelia TaxID=5888 RepID=A0BWP5_PARTE|nr:uncharacterized protein GSPATT00032814001 [Paramecium tetraurelia]CAK62962.1 unnamed protein product [Paramecium tetraurelia]|eukprot:XP_001430360.1 hypothetical protein (macronuclear) [Paramecium tetraurelia strain d4-2]
MYKEENRSQFNKKEKYVINKRIRAFKLLLQEDLISKIVNEKDFLNQMEKKSQMTQEEKTAFNIKYATLYNNIHQEYRKYLVNKRTKKDLNQNRENNPKNNQLLKEIY